jgi:hypothetical protein
MFQDYSSYMLYINPSVHVISQSTILPAKSAFVIPEDWDMNPKFSNFSQLEILEFSTRVPELPVYALATDYYPYYFGWWGKYVSVKEITQKEALLLYGQENTSFHLSTVEKLKEKGLNPQFYVKEKDPEHLVVDEKRLIRNFEIRNQILLSKNYNYYLATHYPESISVYGVSNEDNICLTKKIEEQFDQVIQGKKMNYLLPINNEAFVEKSDCIRALSDEEKIEYEEEASPTQEDGYHKKRYVHRLTPFPGTETEPLYDYYV